MTYKRKVAPKNLFIQLGNLLFENMFHTNYLRILSEISNNDQKCIALIGQDYSSQISFLRRLMRLDDDSFDYLQKAVPPFSLNMPDSIFGIENMNLQGELYDDLSFVVLGNDQPSLSIATKVHLFKNVDVIQVMIDDLHRVSSAINDITERNLFYDFMSTYKHKLLLAYPKAAYFQKDRLHLLVEEVVGEFDSIFSAEHLHWFIYENFEIRYNYYHEIALKIKREKCHVADCLKEWKSLGIPLDDQFNEKILQEQFEEITHESLPHTPEF